ncbi:MAG: hypothetical protein ACK4Y5_12835 [Acetobacteraceae bacterium]|jgi:hypothetical protein
MNVTDSVLADAIIRRDAAKAEADKWDEFIRLYKKLASSSDNTGRSQRRNLTKTGTAVSESVQEKRAASRIGEKGAKTEEAAVAVLLEATVPMFTRDMIGPLNARGVEIGGQDPVATLHVRLSRSKKLKFDRHLGWRLAEPRQEIGAAGPPSPDEPAASENETTSSHVQPLAGGGT